ncbi:MAG: Maf family protein [Bdellovibrionota bacterium]|jgi:septum formation protein
MDCKDNQVVRELILASASEMRSELLKVCGVSFKVCPADIDETTFPEETPLDAIKRLALTKAKVISAKYPDAYVIGADTDVVIDGEVLGKPLCAERAEEMLHRLQGREHSVIGSFAIVCKTKPLEVVESSVTKVKFLPMTPAEIRGYVETGEPLNKAGACSIQGCGMQFISEICGSYSNVIGLDVAALLKKMKTLSII